MTPGARAAIAGVSVALGIYWLHRAGQNRRLGRIVSGIEQLQKTAVANIIATTETGGMPGPPSTLPPDSCFQTLSHFQFAYLVEQRLDGDYLHHIVGKHSGSKGPQLSEAMLAIMRKLVEQFGPAGLEHEVMLHVEALETGSQHIDFMVNPEQHAALLRVLTPS